MSYALVGLAGLVVGFVPIVLYLLRVTQAHKAGIEVVRNDERQRAAGLSAECDRLRRVNDDLDRQLGESRQKVAATTGVRQQAEERTADEVRKHQSEISSLEMQHRQELTRVLADCRDETGALMTKHVAEIQALRDAQSAEVRRMVQVHETERRSEFEKGRQQALAGYRFEVTPFWRIERLGMPGFKKSRVQIGVRTQNFYEGFEITPATERITQEIKERDIDVEEIKRLASDAVRMFVAVKTGGMTLLVHDPAELPKLEM